MPGGKWQNQNHAWYTGEIAYVVLSHLSAKKTAKRQEMCFGYLARKMAKFECQNDFRQMAKSEPCLVHW